MFTKSFQTMGLALMLAVPLIGCAVSKSDEKISANVRTAIAQHPDLGPPAAIHVETHDGVVYLSGIVDTGLSGENLVSVTRRVAGVTDVVSNVSADK